MSKSTYTKEYIQKFVSEKYKSSILLIPVIEGMESQVYSYEYEGQEYIIRINPLLEGFKKDDYAYKHFNSEIIPIPEIMEYGCFTKDHYYCISKKAKGMTYEDSKEEVVEKLLPDITKIKLAINDIDISKTNGYGVFDSETGNAPYNTWREYLLEITNRDWDKIKQKSFIDKDLIDELLDKYINYLEYVPEDRVLLHGDFGNNNIIVENETRFNAVIDWDCAGYGDPLKTVASSYFWSEWLMCAKKVWNYWKELYIETPNFERIMTCYAIRIGLNEVYENALEDDIEMVNWLQNRSREVLSETAFIKRKI